MSDGLASGAAATRIVCARSFAEMPVATPCAASIETVKLVPWTERFCATIGARLRRSACAAVIGHADEPAAVGRHEIDLLGRHEIRGEDEIAFVLAILLVDQHGHPPGLEVGDEIGNGGKAHGAASSMGIAHFTLARGLADTAPGVAGRGLLAQALRARRGR